MRKNRTRVSVAVESNVGIQKGFARKLNALNRAMFDIVQNQILLFLDDKGYFSKALAMDKSLTNPKEDKGQRKQLNELKQKVLTAIARGDKKAIQADVQGFVKKNISKWLGAYNKQNEKICDWMVRNCLASTSYAQKQSLIKAGFPKGQFKAWTVPTVKNHFTSAQASVIAEEFKNKMLENVTRDATKAIYKNSDWLCDWLVEHGSLKDIPSSANPIQDAQKLQRFAQSHANAINQITQKANCESIGITEGIWVHVPGQYTSRESHIKMNGKRFKLSEGLFDEDVKRKVLTGELPYCRCVFRAVIPNEFLNED